MDFEQPIRAWMRKILVDPDLLNIEGCVVNPPQRQAIRDDGCPSCSSASMTDLRISEENRCGAGTRAYRSTPPGSISGFITPLQPIRERSRSAFDCETEAFTPAPASVCREFLTFARTREG
jgi:hypothetical protein